VLLLLGLACTWTTTRLGPTPLAPPPSAQPEARQSAEPKTAASVEPGEEPSLELAESVRIRIHQVEGTSPAMAGVIFEPVVEPMGRCTDTESGSVRVRVVAEGDQTAMAVAPGSEVDPKTRRCVLEALSMLEVADGLPPAPTRAEDPQTFSSTITVSW